MNIYFYVLSFCFLMMSCNQNSAQAEKDHIKNMEEKNEPNQLPQGKKQKANNAKDYFATDSAADEVMEDITNSKSDTLYVGYTYWWPFGGPFIGLCGDSYSFVFTGTVTKIDKPSKPQTRPDGSMTALYTSQHGFIKINNIKMVNPPTDVNKEYPDRNFKGEKYFKSDCFYRLKLKEGDKVIVFVYSYEGYYSIPQNSILKIKKFDDPIVLSVEKYIKNNQNPLCIQADTAIWKKYGFDQSLKQIIECKLMYEHKK